MATTPTQTVLPEQFRLITSVQRIELKLTLTNLVVSLRHLLKSFDILEPDQKTKNLVDQFFGYLKGSCETSEKINQRALWLSIYGRVVEDHLLFLHNKRFQHSPTDGIVEDTHFLSRITALGEAIAERQITKNRITTGDHGVLKRLTELEILAGFVEPDLEDISYLEMVNRVELLTHDIQRSNRNKTHAHDDEEFSLFSDLLALRYIVMQYPIRYKLRDR